MGTKRHRELQLGGCPTGLYDIGASEWKERETKRSPRTGWIVIYTLEWHSDLVMARLWGVKKEEKLRKASWFSSGLSQPE